MKQLIFTLAFLFGWCSWSAGQGVITGQVTDQAGDPLPGATIFILETKEGTAANKGGVYRFENLESGFYTLRISFVGYEPVLRKTSVNEGTSKTILHVQLDNRVVMIDQLVVSSTRVSEKMPFTATILDKETIEKNNLGQDVPYQLRWTPSVVVTSDAGTGLGYTGIRIRGTDPTRVNVTINGIPVNDSESQGVFWVNMPDFISSTEDVQIQRGVGTSTNGAGAFGATINMSTLGMSEDAFAQINTSAGSFNTLRGNIQVGTGLLNDKFAFEGRLSRIYSEGYIDRASADLSSYYLSGIYKDQKQIVQAVDLLRTGRNLPGLVWCARCPDRKSRNSDDQLSRYGKRRGAL
jgi:iron complex outermembrane receptor protein